MDTPWIEAQFDTIADADHGVACDASDADGAAYLSSSQVAGDDLVNIRCSLTSLLGDHRRRLYAKVDDALRAEILDMLNLHTQSVIGSFGGDGDVLGPETHGDCGSMKLPQLPEPRPELVSADP